MPSSFSALRTPFSAMFQKSDELLVTNANFRGLAAGAVAAGALDGAAAGAAPPSLVFWHAAPAVTTTASTMNNDDGSRSLAARMVVLPGRAVDPSPIAAP